MTYNLCHFPKDGVASECTAYAHPAFSDSCLGGQWKYRLYAVGGISFESTTRGRPVKGRPLVEL
jgi:hypothetical protein